MPKKKHGAGASNRPTTNADDSYIVFSNAKDKPENKDASGPMKEQSATNGAQQGAAGEAQKRADTRNLIGGASWTGKLPVNMLAEHCQKQRWEKPEYTMNKTPEGYSSMVILKAVNVKTKETCVLPPFKLPPTHKSLALQPTAVEARHFAATYALFRVCSMRNIHMMLPPTYRELWKGDFQELKREDVRDGRGWMYEADPFAAKQEREKAQVMMAKKRDERAREEAKQAEQLPIRLGGGTVSAASKGHSSTSMKGWSKVPKIEMGKRIRAQMEDLVRRHAVWNPHDVVMSDLLKKAIANEFTELGFRRSHVEEALAECKDREETLEWLLVHVPEDDLPGWSLPEGYSAGISMVSANLKREAMIQRLAQAGYATELCLRVLDSVGEDEGRAAEALQNILLYGDSSAGPAVESDQPADDRVIWEQELNTLEAIFGDRYQSLSADVCQITLDVPHPSKPFLVKLRRPSASYPAKAPVISIVSDSLPAYIRLSIIRQAVEHANKALLGEPMIFNIIDCLEERIPLIIENPGRLRDVSSAATTVGESGSDRIKRSSVRQSKPVRSIDWHPGSRTSLDLFARWQARQGLPQQQKMLDIRRSLPAWKLKDDIVHTVNNCQVTIISGETGSGKSTQSVQFILDDMIQRKLGGAANIICTQPRRISALGLADRVSQERCLPVGDEVGYAIRGESKQKHGTTKITFVTTGVLLRRLQTSGGSNDDLLAALADVSHVVVDEVHERSLDTDFLLVLLKDVLRQRKDLKVVLMSATLDADIFDRYFGQVSSVGRVEVQGRTFPVTDYYVDDIVRWTSFDTGFHGGKTDVGDLDGNESSIAGVLQSLGMGINYKLIARTVVQIDSELGDAAGGILIFLPGTLEINRTLDAVRSITNVHALPLHASLMPSEQRRVFLPPPKGMRKVIAATNVAETSITIEDIVAVIDTGRVKQTSFDPQNNMVKLEEVWASRAACKQRRGRAGRVQAGTCYKLYTRNAEAKMMERPEPEIRRVPLEQLCLSVRAMGVRDVAGFLASALTPPHSLAVEGAVDLLARMGAFDGDELTALGRHLAMIPADLRCGKLMVYGAMFGCLEACLAIAAILTVRSPFVSPQNKREESKMHRVSFSRGQGDIVGDLRAYEEWNSSRKASSQRELRTWCDDHFLSYQTLNDISSNRSQYLSSLKEIGFLPVTYHSSDVSSRATYNRHHNNDALIRALIAGAFNPQLARIEFPEKKFAAAMSGAVELDPEARTIKYFNQDNGRVFVHPSSTLFDAQSFPGNAVYMSYFTKLATSKVFIRDLTPFNAYTLLLFSGPITLDTLGRGLLVDGWLRLRGWARIGVLVSRLRMMLDGVLAKKIDDPEIDLSDNEIVGIVRRLVELDGLDQ